MDNRGRYWRRVGDVLRDYLVCPQCGENAPERKPPRHNLGSLRCDCPEPGQCFAEESLSNGLVWRRSPCSVARCDVCGWTGVLKSRDFETRYGASRCPSSSNGSHDVTVLVYRNDSPGALVLRLTCKLCGGQGHMTIDPVDGVAWERGSRTEE